MDCHAEYLDTLNNFLMTTVTEVKVHVVTELLERQAPARQMPLHCTELPFVDIFVITNFFPAPVVLK